MTAAPTLEVAAVQLDAERPRAEATAAAVTAVGDAADAGARLVVLPEYTSGWSTVIGPDLAEPSDGPVLRSLRDVAARRGVTVLAGLVLPADDPLVATPEGPAGRAANVTVALGPGGELLGAYTKAHLFDAFGVRESDHLVRGDVTGEPLVVDVDGWRVGVLTCYDLRFPESARRLVDAGATVLAAGAAWASGPGKVDQLRVLTRARAIESTAYLVLASQCGRGRSGHSGVVDPRGQVLTELDERGTGRASAALEPGLVATVRAQVPVLEHRRFAVVPRP